MSFINSVLSGITNSEAASTPPQPLTAQNVSSTRTTGNTQSRGPKVSSISGTEAVPRVNGDKRKATDDGRYQGQGNTVKRVGMSTQPSAQLEKSTSTKLQPKEQVKDDSRKGTPSAAKAPPRKGTFAEVLARGKANLETHTRVGAITHKPKEYMSKRERLAALEKERQDRKLSRKAFKSGKRSQQISTAMTGGAGPGTSKNLGKGTERVENGYKGTSKARPPRAELGYKGTGQGKPSLSKRESRERSYPDSGGDSSSGPQRRYRYASYSGEDEESDGSSDMEAAAYELEDEEFKSLRTARKEDDEALREEMTLKKAKLDKKQQALAALKAKRQR